MMGQTKKTGKARMARTLNGRSARAQQRLQERIVDRAVIKYRARISREIARAMRDMYSSDDERAALREHERRIGRILEPLWKDAAKESISNNQEGGKSLSFAELEVKEVAVMTTPTADKIMGDFLRLYAARKITEITSTTQADVAGVVARGRSEGLGEKEIAKQLRSIIPFKSASRAQTIARTESHQASQVAATETAKASGITMKKEWVASKGERTREDHAEVDGQTVEMDQPFNVGGELLMFPGDPSGSAKNVINCRCAVVFVFA